MSDLKYQTLEQLQYSKRDCERDIKNLESELKRVQHKIHNQEIRLQWINKYLEEKTPRRFTMKELEDIMGTAIMIVSEENE